MRVFTSVAPVRVLSVFAVLAALCAAPMGCGEADLRPVRRSRNAGDKQANNAMGIRQGQGSRESQPRRSESAWAVCWGGPGR